MSDQEKAGGTAAEREQAHFEQEQSQYEQAEHKDGMDAWWEERNIPQKVLTVIGFIILGVGLMFLFGWVVMLLWNWLMPEIFGLKTLTYWQAWGVLALSCILFGRIGGGGKGSRSDRKRKRKLRSYIREHIEEEIEKKAKAARE
jgi:hypothetical protein